LTVNVGLNHEVVDVPLEPPAKDCPSLSIPYLFTEYESFFIANHLWVDKMPPPWVEEYHHGVRPVSK
jgi:hypothetical protein